MDKGCAPSQLICTNLCLFTIKLASCYKLSFLILNKLLNNEFISYLSKLPSYHRESFFTNK